MQQAEQIDDVTEVLDEITSEQWDVILAAMEAEDPQALKTALETVHAADIADILEQLSSDQRDRFVQLYGSEFDGDILSEIDESIREQVIEALPREVVAEAVRELDSDDVVDILEDLEQDGQDFILQSLESDDREAVQSAMSWPEGSAGRLMQSETVTVPEDYTVGETIDFLRAAEWLPAQFYHIILVDLEGRPTGYGTLGRILAARRDVHLTDLSEDSFRTVSATEDEGEVARLFNKYHLISMPVVDEAEKLVGVITIDDAMIVLDEEAEEDLLRLAGVSEESSLSDRIWDTVRGRFVWLFVNLLTAILASIVISMFEEELEAMVALAVLMPIVASMGGNAGTQTMTVAVRALATRELTGQNARRVLSRELMVGTINGLAFGVIMSAVAAFWFGVPMLAAVIAMAMVLTLASAALSGIVLPLLLDRAGIDPALASGPFVTTVTDVVGFFAFLGLASVVLL
ncbi:magnesium transporter [Sinisalibacter lacisalsi]|uniref:Magnesium transporter MgtE n=1 Tax=Sinisalibacter lacisalsi TaxID=1526570 RepID=A0ABQ1QKD3_9RHOB|nr:magnesium transporter [Sinisalibacter lacisalsi]GGD30584.1 magnesium transporter MgtE [Sinisalibacter lacisalsi]